MAKAKDLDIIGNITPTEVKEISSSEKESAKAKLKRFVEEESRIVKGRFKIVGAPDGTPHKLIVRKYEKIPPYERMLMSGGIYEIPLYVARHLQGYDVTASAIDGNIHSCSYAVHGYITNQNEFPKEDLDKGQTEPKNYEKRFAFESLEFEKAL